MTRFKGFPPGKADFTRIPSQFFQELLPLIDDLDEMRVTLYTLWALEHMDGTDRYLSFAQYAADETLMTVFKKESTLKAALDKAVQRGSLLEVNIEIENTAQDFYFANTLRGRNAVDAIKKGDWRPSGDRKRPIALELHKPNIFRLYEQHIGPLTPIIAERLQDAEDEYPANWIPEAFGIAVENNVRKWRYIQAILDSWQREGRDDGTNQGHTQETLDKYTKGEFADFIEK